MWFEVLPPAAIMCVCIALPQFAAYAWNSAVFGNPFRRRLHEKWDRHMFQRDGRLTGAPWILQGLEAIPDE